MISNYLWFKIEELNTHFIHIELPLKTQTWRQAYLSTPKTLSIVSIVIMAHQILRNYALLFIIPDKNHIVNHQICLLTNKQYSLRKVQHKETHLRCRCMEKPLFLLTELLDDCFAIQKWYANDGNAVCSLENLKNLFDSLNKHSSASGCHLKKCHMAQQIFVHD